jgi:4-hydroxy-3-polyprenylbenzoate decarboxylase
MKFVIAATGASGSIYLQRLLRRIDPRKHEVHLLLSKYARVVIAEELGKWKPPAGVREYPGDASMHVPFASGSAKFDAMAIVPCSMGTLARIAHGTSETTILRAADVFLKERRKLILVPREAPLHLIHARNLTAVIEAGALVIPAMPSFYHRPKTIEEAVDSVVFRILDHLGLPADDAPRWQTEAEQD